MKVNSNDTVCSAVCDFHSQEAVTLSESPHSLSALTPLILWI